MYYASMQIFVLIGLLIVFQDGQCRYDQAQRAANCSSYNYVSQGDEEALKQAVATIGPISVAIDATRPMFILYHSGMTYFSNYKWSQNNINS